MNADYIFETSWEVCNKVGGIYTVVSTKAKTLVEEYGNNYILIGPDVWKDTTSNPLFEEDPFLFKSWRQLASQNGLRLKIGRWKIVGNPIAILVDFTTFFSEKDKILSNLWEAYKLDSITGQWDYIEPVLFGHAAAKVIESFYDYYIGSHEKIIAHFHEWMTGSGLLYLKQQVPQISTIFTTHATVLGRCIAGNNLPLYSEMDKFNPEALANQFQVKAKHSLESLSAQHADAFTTVSELTANESKHFLAKQVDIVTPNGFEDDFVPVDKEYKNKKEEAREKIFKAVEALLNQKLDRKAMLIINSGRYEFKNKGIDVFIDTMGELNTEDLNRPIISIISVPAHQTGVSLDFQNRLNGHVNFNEPITDVFSTHALYNSDSDPVIQRIKANHLHNSPHDNVKIVFVPAYLNGNDGVFNIDYFDFLIGFDASIFPSYYEPWGYTPMESLAFSIPSITTSLAGFGQWIQKSVENVKGPLAVIKRNDTNTTETIEQIKKAVITGLQMSESEYEALREKSYQVSRQTLWQNFIAFYKTAYNVALTKSVEREPNYKHKIAAHKVDAVQTEWGMQPEWKKVFIKPVVPKVLEGLVTLSQNLWWSWNYDAINLFNIVDESFATVYHENPVEMLASLSMDRLEKLAEDKAFIEKMNNVVQQFEQYMTEEKEKSQPEVAYFCMEFGLQNSIKIFSGGLGLLAGDYLKEASDSNKKMVGVGLLYRYGYFNQQITKHGEQLSAYVQQRFSQLPLKGVYDEKGNWLTISIALPGRVLNAKIWRCDVGRVPLYLLDTDIEENTAGDRTITDQLYGGDWENRLKQEILLGIGGIRLLKALNITPDIYHNNEGHSAFNSIERMVDYMHEDKFTFAEAKELVRASTLFTTHTPVPAGHDAFTEDILRGYFSYITEKLGISWNDFMGLGRFCASNTSEKFSMSVLATNFSQEVNGVSAIHGRVSREMFASLYPGYFPEEIHIGHVTNGVHFPTWVAESWEGLYTKTFGKEFLKDQSNADYWKKIHEVPDAVIWQHHMTQKEALMDFVGKKLATDFRNRIEDPKLWFKVMDLFNTNGLVIGFARRFATYKRAYLLFSNLERLSKLVNNPDRPVHFIFAGKAHPHDKAGQDVIKHIVEVSKRPEFLGKILFLENYDIQVAKPLVRGVDVWLNTPTRPLEASGTSGEKAVMNGVLNFSVLDGWWAEGYKEDAGWALSEEQTFENNDFQNALDAETIYEMLEDEIIPAYYDRNTDSVPEKWVRYMKNNIALIAPHFTMKRQLDDYYNNFYSKLFARTNLLKDTQTLNKLVTWKEKMNSNWNAIELIDLRYHDTSTTALELGEEYAAELTFLLNNINIEDIGVEMVITQKEENNVHKLVRIQPMTAHIDTKNERAVFSSKFKTLFAGVYEYSFRIYPKNELLPHRQDFPLLKWV